MNQTPATEDLLTEDDDDQQFRRELLPLWMKIVSYLFVFGAVALTAAFLLSQVEENWSSVLDAVRGWRDMLILLLLVNCCLIGVTAWSLLREKRWAADFGPVNIGISVLVVAYAVVEIMWSRLKHPVYGLNFEDLIVFAIFILLCTYLYRLLAIRKEWKLRRSGITGNF